MRLPSVLVGAVLMFGGVAAASAAVTESQFPPNTVRDLRARPEIIESTFDRVRYGFTTEFPHHMLWWWSMLNPSESGFPQ